MNLNRLPIGLIALIYLSYLSFDLYSFMKQSNSPLAKKQIELASLRKAHLQLTEKGAEVEKFSTSLVEKKAEVLQLLASLDEIKKTISDRADMPGFMKMAVTEAKKIGLIVLSLKPEGLTKNKELYNEQNYILSFRGAYIQLFKFVERLSNVSEIVAVENFEMKPIGSAHANYVEMEGMIQIKTYSYLVSQADRMNHMSAELVPNSIPTQPKQAHSAPGAQL